MTERDYTLQIKTEGGPQAAGEVNALADAEQRLVAQVAKLSEVQAGGSRDAILQQMEAVGAARKEFVGLGGNVEALDFKFQGFAQTVALFSPIGAQFINQLRGAFQMAGQLGDAQINLSDLWTKGRAALSEYAGAFKLLGAGGLALGALYALKAAWDGVKQSNEEANKALADFQKQAQAIGELKEALRSQIIELAVQINPNIDEEELRRKVDEAFRLVQDKGIEPSRAVGMAMGAEAPMSPQEAALRTRFGPNSRSRAEAAGEELGSFNFGASGLFGRGKVIDSGGDAALMEYLGSKFPGESDEQLQGRRQATQTFIAGARESGLDPTKLTPDEAGQVGPIAGSMSDADIAKAYATLLQITTGGGKKALFESAGLGPSGQAAADTTNAVREAMREFRDGVSGTLRQLGDGARHLSDSARAAHERHLRSMPSPRPTNEVT